jgi:hypothetical protein
VLWSVKVRLQAPPIWSRLTLEVKWSPFSAPLTGRTSEAQVTLPCAWNEPGGSPRKVARTEPALGSASTTPDTCIRSWADQGNVLPNDGLVMVTAAEGWPTGVTVTVAR